MEINNNMSGNNPPDPAAKASLVFALKQLLPSDRVIHETEALRPYECDGLPAYRQMPLVAVLPDSVEQVQQIMQLCHKRKIPVVARCTATSLSGGALPLADRVLLSLAKFNKILDIDTANRTALVQPGVRNLAIS